MRVGMKTVAVALGLMASFAAVTDAMAAATPVTGYLGRGNAATSGSALSSFISAWASIGGPVSESINPAQQVLGNRANIPLGGSPYPPIVATAGGASLTSDATMLMYDTTATPPGSPAIVASRLRHRAPLPCQGFPRTLAPSGSLSRTRTPAARARSSRSPSPSPIATAPRRSPSTATIRRASPAASAPASYCRAATPSIRSRRHLSPPRRSTPSSSASPDCPASRRS